MKIKAKIQNNGSIEKKNIPIELYLSEDRIGQIVSNFSLKSSKEYQFESYPGKTGVVKGSIQIGKDEFMLDNKKEPLNCLFLNKFPARLLQQI